MDQMNINPPQKMQTAAVVALSVLSLFLVAKVFTEFKQFSLLDNQMAMNVITVNGLGEVYAKADIASINFSIVEEAKTVAEAQKKATEKNNNAVKYLKDSGVDEKDVKTVGYYINPKYSYDYRPCTLQYPSVCPQGNQSIIGYEVSISIEVKIRNVEKAGEILSGVGAIGVSNLSGLSFTIDDDASLKAEARKLAIEDAKTKAKKLSKDLGVSLGKVTSFYENMDTPYYYDTKYSGVGYGGGGAPAMAPEISVGQNKVSVSVSVTYRIK